MSNYVLNWRRASLTFAALSIAILIPHQLDAKGLEPPAWPWAEVKDIAVGGLIFGAICKALSTIRDFVLAGITTRNMGIGVGAVLGVLGGGVSALEFVRHPGRHNETSKASIKILGTKISYIGAASFGMVVASIVTIVLAFRYYE
jgi:hypothetical protein